jgi:sensor domain CHASE-containing protein
MYGLKEELLHKSAKPIRAAKKRRQLYPFFFQTGPIALGLVSCVLIGLMAILYLNQVAQVTAANEHLQQLNALHDQLERQNQQLQGAIGSRQSPQYIQQQARALGLVPADLGSVPVVVVHVHTPLPDDGSAGVDGPH